MKPKRIQLKRTKDWRMPPNTVKVDRTTKWGNPFRIGFEATNAYHACQQFLMYCCGDGTYPERRERMGDIGVLKGKNLACWCAVGQPCHAEMLLAIANGWDVLKCKRIKP